MKKRNYTHVQVLLPEIKAMLDAGKTQREVAEYFGLQNKYVVKQLLTRERRKERELEAGVIPRPKGRPRKEAAPGDIAAEQEAIACYTRILSCVRDEEVCSVVTKIRADEERHLHILREMQSAL